MTSKQLSSLLRKTPPATVAREPEGKPQAVQEAAATPEVSREVQLHVLVPAHVRKQVDIMGAHEGVSLRTLVLRGLREIGIRVSDEEIRGGHKRERRKQ